MTKLTLDSRENIEIVKKLAKQTYSDNLSLAQLCVAQAILESNLEEKPSMLAYTYCNLFGIKPGLIRTGTASPGSIYLNTEEYGPKGWITIKQPFVSNLQIEDSFEQHKTIITKLARYENLINAKTFEEAATKIVEDGYCTDPNYTKLLLNLYSRNNLGNM